MTNKLCIYCENNQESQHFICEYCGVGMCDECYDNFFEHDGHYHRICEHCDEDQYNKIIACFNGNEPDYLCEDCLSHILHDNL